MSVIQLEDRTFSDLAIFRGMKLHELGLSGCTNVSDLSPLADMPLKVLNLRGTGVSDLSPLTKMPLVELDLDGCVKLTNLQPLKDCRTLERLLLPRNAKNIEFLRHHPTLKYLSARGLSEPVAQFWADYDKRRAGKGKQPGDSVMPPIPPGPPGSPAGKGGPDGPAAEIPAKK